MITEQQKMDHLINETYKELVIKFDKLLKGINTEKFKTTTKEKNALIKRIQGLLTYRVKQLKNECPKLLIELSKKNFKKVKVQELEELLLELPKKSICELDYFKIKKYEEGKANAEKSFKKFIKLKNNP